MTTLIPRAEVRVSIAERRRIVERLDELLDAGTRQITAALELAKLEGLDRHDESRSSFGGELDEPAATRMRDTLLALRCELEEIQLRPLRRATEEAGRLASELTLLEDGLRLHDA